MIGVYEPLMLVTESGRSQTSLAARPELYGTNRACYHGACFEEMVAVAAWSSAGFSAPD